ncbi:hypothetical protein SAMN05216516_102171 [Izhakiella capsodis]|uniref:Uncharacterized protein n=1 Tax=Izhakiella capsodis TaxID=1367852 RepID=A0A1I4VYX6_9GAMM|nr:hypothetical protein SAMN05216516_102171 [Izhakiella capsodis]
MALTTIGASIHGFTGLSCAQACATGTAPGFSPRHRWINLCLHQGAPQRRYTSVPVTQNARNEHSSDLKQKYNPVIIPPVNDNHFHLNRMPQCQILQF